MVVSGESVTYALNNNSASFDATVQIESADVNGDIPNRTSEVTVLYADMNANGSSDIVWIGPSGQVDYLELFPVRPNLMTRVTNAIGQVTEVAYGTIVAEMARDGGIDAWEYRLPSPMNVVKRMETRDLLSNVPEITEYDYHDGYYDGAEKQFRGFERVETRMAGDATIEDGWTQQTYDVGATDPYRNGLLLSARSVSGGRELSEMQQTYEPCPLAQIPEGTALPIKYICHTRTEVLLKEGVSEDRWLTLLEENQYDGYGNVTRASKHGVVSVGGEGCEPCGDRDPDAFGAPCDRGGAQCVGDEVFTTTEFIEPGEDTNGRWILNAPMRKRVFGREGSELVSEQLTYYDGDAFEGLPLGQLDLGNVSRTTAKIRTGSDDVIQMSRFRYDSHGNIAETLDPLGTPGGNTHRRAYTYDEEHLRPIQVDLFLEDRRGEPYQLRQEIQYEPLFDKPFEATAWLRVEDDQIVSAVRGFAFTYDEFGRLKTRTLPGNPNIDQPDEENTYILESPVSRIITRKRSQAGGAFDVETIRCVDGRGRGVQTRTRLEDGSYQVSGLTRFNTRAQPVELFQPYTSSSELCDTAPPEWVRSERYRYDATYRLIERTLPDGDVYGEPSRLVTIHEPLATVRYDSNDNDPMSPHADTPTTTRENGAGLMVAMERQLTAGGEPSIIQAHYDSLGRVTGYTDPGGNRKEQQYDLLGRVTRVIDPNSGGETTFEYDDASNITRKTDDRGVTTVHVYDGMNRAVETFDADDREGTLIETRYDRDPACGDCTHGEGLIVSVSYPGVGEERAIDTVGYDLRQRAVLRGRTLAGETFVTTTTYDNIDRPVAVTYPSGQTIERSFNPGSQLTEIVGVASGFAYDRNNLLSQVRYADGTTVSMAYDSRLRMTHKRTEGQDGVLQGFAFDLDRVGNILAIEDLAEERDDRPHFGLEYGYDSWYRTTTTHFDAGGDRDELLRVEFNALDNITAVTSSLGSASAAHVGGFSYDSFAPNAVTDAGGLSFDYDMAGNVDTRGAQSFQWDFMNRLTQVSEGGEVRARFTYGSNQGRVVKTEGDSTTLYLSDTFELRDGISTLYIKSDRHRIARIESDELATTLFEDGDGDGQITAADALLATDREQAGPMLWSAARRLLIETGPDDGATFLHHDVLGSITLATGTRAGELTVLGQRSFNPTGSERERWGYVDTYGFTGQEQDRSTGLIRFLWRYLDPVTGRWLSIDPAFSTTTAANISKLGESTTAYAYVGGNFANVYDPTGLAGKSALRKGLGRMALKARGKHKAHRASKQRAKARRAHAQMVAMASRPSSFTPDAALDTAETGPAPAAYSGLISTDPAPTGPGAFGTIDLLEGGVEAITKMHYAALGGADVGFDTGTMLEGIKAPMTFDDGGPVAKASTVDLGQDHAEGEAPTGWRYRQESWSEDKAFDQMRAVKQFSIPRVDARGKHLGGRYRPFRDLPIVRGELEGRVRAAIRIDD